MSKLSVVKRMRQRFRLREITVVADRGMVSKAISVTFEQSDPPVRYILGGPYATPKAWEPRTVV